MIKVLLSSIVMLLLASFNVNAQPGGQPQNPPPVPITGIEYLLIGGGAYGVSRLLKNRNKKKTES